MLTKNTRLGAGLSIAFAAALALTACSSGTDTASMESSAPMAEPIGAAMAEETTMDPAAGLVGPGCAGYADAVPDGAGSIEGMSQDPVAVADTSRACAR